MTSNDGNVKVYGFHRLQHDPDNLPPDYYALLSFLCGVVGLLLKIKTCSWFSLLFSIASISTVRSIDMDMRQTAASVMFGVMGIVSNHLNPY